jgi:flagellar FliJ protein
MSWQDSLIRISNHEIESLQRRLAEVVERRTHAELRLAILEADTQIEIVSADKDPQGGWYRSGFLEAARARRASLHGEIDGLVAEEAGARDALSEAFEALKKFEHVAELGRVAAAKIEARREAVVLDDLGLRQRAR